MKFIEANSFAELYQKAMHQVYENYDFCTKPRNMNIRECMNVFMQLSNPFSNLFKTNDKTTTLQTGYLKKELSLYLSGSFTADHFAKASRFWDSIKNPDDTINSAYGYLIFSKPNEHGYTQFDWAVKSLQQDKDSRQAIMHFNSASHQRDGIRDFPCTLTATFHIRDNKLNMTTVMRSNDIRKGLQYDLPFFTMLQRLVQLRLVATAYPTLEMGTYSHLSQSLHIYENDFEYAQNVISSEMAPNEMPRIMDSDVILSKDMDDIVAYKFDGGVEPNLQSYRLAMNAAFYDWIKS